MRNRLLVAPLILLSLTVAPVYAEGMNSHDHAHMHTDGSAAVQAHQGEGTVNKVDIKAGKINLTHGPIASLNWPGMTMDLDVQNKDSLNDLKPGQKIVFKLVEARKRKYVISEISIVK
ncbi:MAG: copper-binding protein [Gammaproteobacteria bacterium]|nr:copper-binding protein [Gammaproteobacteria bacterium]